MRALLVATIVGIAGCTEYDQQATLASDQSLCQQMGAKTDDQIYQCMAQQQQVRQNEDLHRRAAAGAYARMLQTNNQPTPVFAPAPQRTNCRYNPVYDSVQCTTF